MMMTDVLARHTGFLPVTMPFSFQRSADFISRFSPMAGEQSSESGSITKALAIAGQPVVFRLTPDVSAEQPRVKYELFASQPLSSSVQAAVVDRIRLFLSLDDDLKPFYALAQADADFAPIVRQLYGLHHVRFLTLGEIACWAILTQRLAIPLARQLKRTIVTTLGQSLEVDGRVYWAFPELATLAALSEAEWLALVPNERKAAYLYKIMPALNSVDEVWLRTAPYAEVEAWLRQLPGIGPWSASFILLRGLGRMEQLPLDSAPIQQAVRKVYGSQASIAEVGASYGDQIGYWSFYLRVANG